MLTSGSRILRLMVLLSFLVSLFSRPLFTQDQLTGSLTGRAVFKENRAAAPNAKIIIRDDYRGVERSVLTGDDGEYFVPFLQPGTYTLYCELEGYETPPYGSVKINVSTPSIISVPPFELAKIGGALPPPAPQPQVITTKPSSESVEAEAQQLVNLNDASRGGNFDQRQLLSLPLPSIRSFDSLVFLLPGVAPPPQAIGGTVGPGIGPGVGTSGQFTVNGLRSRSNNFTVDGSDNNDEDVGVRRQGFTSLVPQSIESLQGLHATTLLPTPQYGRNMAGQVNAVSRFGERNFHGTIYGFLTDQRFNAHDFFDNSSRGGPASFPITRLNADGSRTPVTLDGEPLAPSNPGVKETPFTRAQYGFVFGGPVSKEKNTFFFSSFERQEIHATQKSHFAVPTVKERGLLRTGDTGFGTATTDGRLFPTSETGDAFFSLFPFPNNNLGPYGPNTYTDILPASAHGTIFSIKLDQKISERQSLTGRYNLTDDNTILPVTGEALFSSLRPLVRTQNFSLFHNWAISSNFANQGRFSFGRTRLQFDEVRNPFLIPSKQFPGVPFLLNAPLIANNTVPGTNPRYSTKDFQGNPLPDIENAKLIPVSGAPEKVAIGPLGEVIVSGYSPIGVDVFNFPQQRANNTFQYADTFIYNRHRHRITAGADIRRSQLNSNLERNFRPLAIFDGALNLSRNKALVSDRTKISDALGGPLSTIYFNSPTAAILRGSDFMAVGAPNGFFQAQALVPDATIGLRYWQNDFFIADEIHLHPRFSLTLGLRYEYNTVPSEVNNRIENTFKDPEIQKLPDLVRVLGGRSTIYRNDRDNFGPHLAFAWDPFGNGKTALRGGYGIYYDQILGAVVSQSRNVFPSFTTLNFAGVNAAIESGVLNLSNGLGFLNPAVLAKPGTLNTYTGGLLNNFIGTPADLILDLNNIFSGLSAGSAGAAFTLPVADLQTPYAQHWGLTLEQELNGGFLISAGYVGTRGLHLLRFATPNLGPNAIPLVKEITGSSSSYPVFIGDNIAPGFIPATNTGGRPSPELGSFQSIVSDANSTYHSMQLQLNKRFSRGIQFTTAYTWSHAIDEVSDLFNLAGTRTIAQNSFSNRPERKAERGSANFDVRHRFVYSAIWDLPIFRLNKVLGGWQFASIGTFQTGQPYSKYFCCDGNLDGNFGDRIIVTPGETAGSTVVTQNAPRNLFRAPGVADVDLAINKRFKFGQSQSVEFRSEFFNLFNRTHFGIPVNERLFPGMGTQVTGNFVNTRIPARIIQFALKYNF